MKRTTLPQRAPATDTALLNKESIEQSAPIFATF
jgi:hypothetical protein